jgi:hypothetical protein
MKNSEFMLEARKRIPKSEDVINTTLHTMSEDGWCVMVTTWEDDSRTTNAEFHIRYKLTKNQKPFHLWGYKLKTSTDWVIGKPSRGWF